MAQQRSPHSMLILLLALLLVLPVAAQNPLTAVTTQNLKVRSGPGRGYPVIAQITANTTLILEGRDNTGEWILGHPSDSSTQGWVAAAYLQPGDGVQLAALPVSEQTLASEVATIMEKLRATPIVPQLTATARAIYEKGLASGNHPERFSKVGDCQNIPLVFLGPFDRGEYQLGPYQELQVTIDYFAGSFNRESQSVKRGFNVYAVLDPGWAGEECRAGESPQECEYRLWQPSFVIISLEMTSGITVEGYEAAMRDILNFWIKNGVVPILASKANNREGDWSINAVIARLAWEYDVPLWNLLMATQPLPDYGLTDGFHLTYAPNDFGSADSMQAGWPWRNLSALQTLDVMRRAVTG